MRILYPLSETTPSYGGIGAYTYKIIHELVKKYPDYEAVIVTSNQLHKDTFVDYFKDNRKVKIRSLFEHNYEQIFRRDFQFQIKLALKINRIIKNEKIDLIHHQTGHSDMFFSLPLLGNLPTIMTSHGDISALLKAWKNVELQNINEKMNYRLGKILYHEEKYMYKKSDVITPVADHVRLNIIKNYQIPQDKIKTINNFVDPEQFYFHPGEFTQPYKIGFIGRPYYIKGFYNLIECINKNTNKELFEWHLVTDSKLAKKLIKTERNIKYYDSIPQSELSKFYDPLDFMFIPSYSEACPTVLLESLMKGKYCIVRDLMGTQEILSNCTSDIFKDSSQVDFLDITKNFTDSKTNLMENLKENREIIKRRYSITKILDDVYKLYKSYC
jgi:glycosyltransferase involved in cell wall biosynthesis